MKYSAFKEKRRLEQNSEASPAKFLSLLFGGSKRRREQRAANEDHEYWMTEWDNQKMNNPYAGVKNPYADMENVYEDAQVNLQAADYAREQSQQNMANIMNNMSAAAGSSGVAGLAQVLANQGVQQARQQSVDIGKQEQGLELRALGEAGRLDQLERTGEQKRDMLERKGTVMVEEFDRQKVKDQLTFARERKGYADAAVDQARASRDAFLSSAVSAAIPMMSDIRLKENITHTGTSESGIPIYTFNYKDSDKLWSGTTAQDLLNLGREDAVEIMHNGYYGVDYGKIDVDMVSKN
jgi:hypothetical protein|tara:strand:+ start:1757 stop:2641 length:885 start_codon:yes stop_codon:yes gene_type:complete